MNKQYYCEYCGQQLVNIKGNYRYNFHTGQPNSSPIWKCPNTKENFRHTKLGCDEYSSNYDVLGS